MIKVRNRKKEKEQFSSPRRIIVFTLLFILIVGTVFFVQFPDGKLRDTIGPRISYALPPFVFGGPIQSFPCTCFPGVAIVFVGPPRPGVFSYILGTQPYANWNLPIARLALGTYTPSPGVCWVGFAPVCTLFPTQGIIDYLVGSSL